MAAGYFDIVWTRISLQFPYRHKFQEKYFFPVFNNKGQPHFNTEERNLDSFDSLPMPQQNLGGLMDPEGAKLSIP
jgi:hypothetical protein